MMTEKRLMVVVILGLVVIIGSCQFYVAMQTRETYYGVPISGSDNLQGKVFHPRAVVVSTQFSVERILIYDEDRKVYALDGIVLDNIKPEQLLAATNATYQVYQTNGQTHLRRETFWF